MVRTLPAYRYAQVASYAMYNRLHGECVYPFYASYKVTHHCPLQCKFCNVWKEDTPDLKTPEVKKVLDNLGRSSIFLLSLEGGDPLLRHDLVEILKYARTKPFYLFFTTSGDLFDKRPMKDIVRWVDYLHISIDEGHGNLFRLDELAKYQAFGRQICVQTVVTRNDIGALEEKVAKVHAAGARTVVMPACHLDNTDDYYPEPGEFAAEILRLRREYPNTITTPLPFLDNIAKPHGCSTSSIIIDSDGGLFYPCRTLGEHHANLVERDLMEFVRSEDGARCRMAMRACDRRCGWYQYFATDAFSSIQSLVQSFSPYLRDVVRPSKTAC
jgi:MoaA/NifB/PqqE/SkfB family radical SAM enzyme